MRVINLVPKSFRKVIVHKISRDFVDATRIVTCAFPHEVKPTEVIVRNIFAGVNASDINYTAGVYRPSAKLPFDAGFEGMGEVVAVGSAVKAVDLGDYVQMYHFGTFSEYQVVPVRNVRKVRRPDERYLPLEVSAVTASIALEKVLEPRPREAALVTAAAGGTGQFAVQLLKQKYQCHVIGTCSSPLKAEFLRSIGVDRVVNYKEESLDNVLAAEYRSGVNVVYESVGGELFDVALKHLATRGRLGVIGNIVGYRDGSSFGEPAPASAGSTGADAAAALRPTAPIGTSLLSKSASVRGFFLPHFQKHVNRHFDELSAMVDDGTLKSTIDPRPFYGIESAAAAVEHLHSGKSTGKVLLRVGPLKVSSF